MSSQIFLAAIHENVTSESKIQTMVIALSHRAYNCTAQSIIVIINAMISSVVMCYSLKWVIYTCIFGIHGQMFFLNKALP